MDNRGQSRWGRHFASKFAAANFERRASIGVSSQLRTLLGPEVLQQAAATALTKYDLFAPLHLATDNWLGASRAALTRLRCRPGKLMRSFRCSRPPFCAACPNDGPPRFLLKALRHLARVSEGIPAKVFATLNRAFEAVRTCSESITDEAIEA